MNVSTLVAPLLQRLPLFELGATASPAIPLLQPTRFTQPLTYPSIQEFLALLNSVNFPYCPASMTVGVGGAGPRSQLKPMRARGGGSYTSF